MNEIDLLIINIQNNIETQWSINIWKYALQNDYADIYGRWINEFKKM